MRATDGIGPKDSLMGAMAAPVPAGGWSGGDAPAPPNRMDRGAPPPGGMPPQATGHPEQRKRRRLVLLAVFLALFGVGSASASWYAITRRPLTTLPGVSVLAKGVGPRFVVSILGVTTPEAVAVTPDGQRIYVVESGGDRLVRSFNANGQETGRMAPPGTQVATRMPMSIALSPEGRVFVSDRLRRAVDMYTPDGQYVGAYRPDAVLDEPWLPMGLSFDGNGRLFITDHATGRHRVLVFRPNDSLDMTVADNPDSLAAALSYPYSVAVDSQGRMYVSDGNNARVVTFDRQGKMLSAITNADPKSSLGLPRGIVVDGQDRLYVADTTGHTVVVYEAGDTPKFLFTFGELGIKGGEFRYPNGIALDGQGRIYVADRDNNSVQVWAY